MGLVGWLVGGKFHCDNCAAQYYYPKPKPIAVDSVNIDPYSQVCCECKKLVVDGLRSIETQGPLSLFN